MRKLLTILLMLVSLSLGAATYYVATDGNDTTGDGSIGTPWATWQKGFSELTAGDTLYIRGGSYAPSSTEASSAYNAVVIDGVEGTSGSYITVMNYPGEKPILTGTGIIEDGARRMINLLRCDYWILDGLEIAYMSQNTSGNFCMGIQLYTCTNIYVRNCKIHHIGGMAFNARVNCDDIIVSDCDAYECYDPYTSTVYDDADGFGSSNNAPEALLTFERCRAWNNADDGFDFYNDSAYVIVNRCAAWGHGYREDRTTSAQGGSGIKLGITDDFSSEFKREVTYSMFFYNRIYGMDHSELNGKLKCYNNTIYGNGSHGIQKSGSPDLAHEYYNNVSAENGGNAFNGDHVNAVISNNSYDSSWEPTGVVITVDDFKSAYSFRLKATSGAIDAGTDIGLTYDFYGHKITGTPDIGAMEYGKYTLQTGNTTYR